MRKIYCAIADDEELAREVIENYISKVDELTLVALCSKGSEVYNVLQNNTIDLLFLDIEMPELSGIELLKTLKNPPSVIMTTAYREYAVEGYELDVLDYLLKPISFERFLKAIDKFMVMRGNSVIQKLSAVNVQHDPEAFIYIRSENKMVRLLLNDILFIEGLKESVKVQTKDKTVITYQSLNYFEEKLSIDRFIRVHRSYIIALRHISSYTATEIKINTQTIPIGVTFTKKVIQRLEQWG